MFMSADKLELFQYLKRYRDSSECSTLIVMPGSAFWKEGQTYRSDIKWMWKQLRGNNGRIEVGQTGYLTLLLTDEPSFYVPSNNVIKGSFADAALMWAWIKFVCSHSWYKQKQGKLRKLFDGHDVSDYLGILSEEIIKRDM